MSQQKIKACTVGAKHSWEFVKNVTLKSMTINSRGTSVRLSFKGIYRCACGGRKYGTANTNVINEVKP